MVLNCSTAVAPSTACSRLTRGGGRRQPRDLRRNVGQNAGRALSVHVLDPNAGFDQLDELWRKWRDRQGLGHRENSTASRRCRFSVMDDLEL